MGETTIHPFPELRAYAESEALSLRSVLWAANPGSAVVPNQRDTARGILTLLCDLSRPGARDVVARLVAVRIGLCAEDGLTFRMAATPGRCSLARGLDVRMCHIFDATDTGHYSDFHGLTRLPSLIGVTDPAEALAIIVRHLWPDEVIGG